jgi:hypothetical protein
MGLASRLPASRRGLRAPCVPEPVLWGIPSGTSGRLEGERINARNAIQPSNDAAARGGGTNRFGLLLIVLVATYLLSAFGTGGLITALQVVLFGAVAVLAARTAPLSRLQARLAAATALAGTAIMLGVALASEPGKGVANLWFALILLFAVIVIVRRILRWPAVTIQSIYGAVSAYLILGLMFAAIFSAIDHLAAGHFFAHGQPANNQTFQYFSFTTLTTLGYGDFTAASSGGRAVAILEALTGQIFLATLIARLVASFRGSSDRNQGSDRRVSGDEQQQPPFPGTRGS